MSCAPSVAHRAARPLRIAIPAVLAFLVALTASVSTPQPAAAATYAPRVVVVVGPSGASTSKYLDRANLIASQAASYGAQVTKIYTPNATWARVVSAAQGANVFVYLGHGNGWPSPYAPYQGATKDGLGLNPYAGSGTSSPVKYYGEDLIAAHIRFAPGAVVILNHLCYASGNGEPGSPEPTWTTARKRVDNYAAGFIKARASAIIADGHTNLGYELHALFGGKQSLLGMWRHDPDYNGHERTFSSERSSGWSVHLDPEGTSTGFYRSIVTRSKAVTTGIRIRSWRGHATTKIVLRDRGSVGGTQLATLASGQTIHVTGAASTDGAGRTWVPVVTLKGQRGWVAGWHVAVSGSAAPRYDVWLRKSASTKGSKIVVVRSGSRVTIAKSTHDSHDRLWLYVRTSSGRYGWVAGWLMRP